MKKSSSQPLLREERCVTTLITAAKETSDEEHNTLTAKPHTRVRVCEGKVGGGGLEKGNPFLLSRAPELLPLYSPSNESNVD